MKLFKTAEERKEAKEQKMVIKAEKKAAKEEKKRAKEEFEKSLTPEQKLLLMQNKTNVLTAIITAGGAVIGAGLGAYVTNKQLNFMMKQTGMK